MGKTIDDPIFIEDSIGAKEMPKNNTVCNSSSNSSEPAKKESRFKVIKEIGTYE